MNVAPKAISWTGSGWDDDILLWYYEDQEIVKQRNEAIGASGTHPHHGGGKFATPTSTHKQYCATHNHSEHPQAPTSSTVPHTSTHKHPQAPKSIHSTVPHTITRSTNNTIPHHARPYRCHTISYRSTVPKKLYIHITPYHKIPKHPIASTAWLSCWWCALEIGNCNAGNHLRIWESFLTTMVVGALWSSSLPARYTRPHQPLVVKFLALFPRCL